MLHKIETFPVVDPLAKKRKKKLSDRPYLHETARVRDSEIGGWTALGPYTTISESTFDDYSYTAGYVSIIYSDVGKFCSIANSVRINPGNHPQWRVTQHHCTYRRIQYGFDTEEDLDFFQWRRDARCRIGHDVWIGHGATIMPGVQVGIGAVIGAGAVVTKNIGDYEVAVGVPARVIKKRFPDDVIEKLLSSAWWDWDRQTLEERFYDLMDLNLFLDKYA